MKRRNVSERPLGLDVPATDVSDDEPEIDRSLACGTLSDLRQRPTDHRLLSWDLRLRVPRTEWEPRAHLFTRRPRTDLSGPLWSAPMRQSSLFARARKRLDPRTED